MHQPEIREVVRTSVVLGHHVVHVDLFAIVQSLVADRTESVLPPGELPWATGQTLSWVPPLVPVVLESRVIRQPFPLSLQAQCSRGQLHWPFVNLDAKIPPDVNVLIFS